MPDPSSLNILSYPGGIKTLGLTIPTGLDFWYLYHGGTSENVLGELEEETLDALADFLNSLGDMEPMQAQDTLEGIDSLEAFKDGNYYIKKMRYEVATSDFSYQFDTQQATNEYPVYIAIPIGQLGVMEVLSIARSQSGIEIESNEKPVHESGKSLAPLPKELETCYGTHLIEKGWDMAKDDSTSSFADYPTEDFAGKDSQSPLLWLRYYFHTSETQPVPGEFIAILAKPYPFHVWFYQKTSPFLYSGNWFETAFYSSGEITVKTAPSGDEATYTYTVQCKAETIDIMPSDLYEYDVGDRVTILKTATIPNANFDWEGIGAYADKKLDIDWKIIPITFYEE